MATTHKPPIFDGHNDLLHKLHESSDPVTTFFTGRQQGHLDYPRAQQAGFAGGLFAVFVPNPPSVPEAKQRIQKHDAGYRVEIAPPLEFEYANRIALDMINLFHDLIRESQGRLRMVRNRADLDFCLSQDVMGAVLHLEGAEPIHPTLANLEAYYRQGVRSLGITWSRENAFGHGVPFEIPASPDIGPGLTPAGKKLVRSCNEMGILIDVAHLNEKGFWDVAERSDAPLVCSHSASHNLIPRSRNLTDNQLHAVAESNGLVGVTFSVNDLDGGRRPKKDADPDVIIRHMQYIADLIGVDHLAFGSDLDGTTIPSKIGDVSGFLYLIEMLQEAGFTAPEIEKICHQNWIRVLKETWH